MGQVWAVANSGANALLKFEAADAIFFGERPTQNICIYIYIYMYRYVCYVCYVCRVCYVCHVCYCIVLYCIVLYCIVLYCIVLYCIVLFAGKAHISLENLWFPV